MRYLFVLLAMSLTLPMAAFAQDTGQHLYFGFLDSTGNTALSSSTGQPLKAGDMANPNRLRMTDWFVFSGSIEEAGNTRGIALINADSKAAALAEFDSNPLVREGSLKPQVYEFDGSAAQAGPEINGISEKHSIVLLKHGQHWKDTGMTPLVSEPSWIISGALAIAGTLEGDKQYFRVLIFRSADQSQISSLLDLDPDIASGRVAYDEYPVNLPPGVIAPLLPPLPDQPNIAELNAPDKPIPPYPSGIPSTPTPLNPPAAGGTPGQ